MLRAKCTLFLQHIYTLNEVDKNNGKQKSHFFRWNVHIPQAHIKRICYTHRCKDVAMDSCLRSATQKTPNRNKTNVNRINHKIIYTKYYLLIPSIFFCQYSIFYSEISAPFWGTIQKGDIFFDNVWRQADFLSMPFTAHKT